MTEDRIEQFHGATIQHGPESDRIYLMKTGTADLSELPGELKAYAKEKGYSKIIAKVPASAASRFIGLGYSKEASIPGFYNGRETAEFLCYYPDSSRRTAANSEEIQQNISLARRMHDKPLPELPEGVSLVTCTPDNAEEMSALYREVFPSYPFPIDNPDYIRETMQTHIVYFGALCNGRFVALSSAEMDEEHANVEMTDFATLPAWRGHSLAVHLLKTMETAMKKRGIRTAYTIARAASPGMNITFSRAGYTFGGTLVNNTNISGGIESMNIWYTSLAVSRES
ncbi:putative beta-lysine N-acetyltransferase [Prosthecochloris sp. N3]|uniref:Beta-lysine N-acetyltransferase n=1 Tax=Prosthecochloris ethylica TaxID=2743976 RepID=A0ABR9XU16_9CHLB|nr:MULTISPECIES: putative beta-lysine N-acetyltransferase [Prosthecochloris]MBF0586610.1 putative beta-lysine N-acetyltransferase [Prosthecochloris ethylica]MBF0637357.1 putative beta-lysine N-acetyltransferase [Prosthecochloris ethylica]NUK48311.1 putative beta-lysine N-acetyltransferase [Prosthecochloris ethylica]RNA65139.1 putative beta-lysine N-acetyltransferase [Prosthecochloris sp. ZM_2]